MRLITTWAGAKSWYVGLEVYKTTMRCGLTHYCKTLTIYLSGLEPFNTVACNAGVYLFTGQHGPLDWTTGLVTFQFEWVDIDEVHCKLWYRTA